ncbi:hypothetical protein BJX99DRAFT_10207 [Aspergillus californicus]
MDPDPDPAQLDDELSRPETDYEIWLREQDRPYNPGARPIYEPVAPLENGHRKSFFRFLGLGGHSMSCGLTILILLVIIAILSVKLSRRRRPFHVWEWLGQMQMKWLNPGNRSY